MKERKYSKAIANAIKSFLTEDDWNFTFNEDRGTFRFGLAMEGKLKKLSYIVRVHDDFTVYATSPLGPDTDDSHMMSEVAEFICRANYGLKSGNFEYDFDDGEIRFKCYVNVSNMELSSEVIQDSIYCPAAMFDRYSTGLFDVIFRESNARDTIESCESSVKLDILKLLTEISDSNLSDSLSTMIDSISKDLGLSTPSATNELTEGNTNESPQFRRNLFGTEGDDN